jgi:hypothetical protein
MDFLYRAEAAASRPALLAGALALLAAGGALHAAAQAQEADRQSGDSTGLLNSLLECRALVEPAARLACYDAAAAAVSTARSSGDLLVADRTKVKAEREVNFGGAADRGPWDDEPEVKERTFVVKSLQQTPGMLFIFVMEDGSVWQQTESVIMRRPKPGDQVLVKSGAMGGFMAKVNEGRQFRIKRVR